MPKSIQTRCRDPKIQWNLRTTDALGAGLLSFVERLSLSRRLALSKLAPRPSYVWLASSPGFPVWVRLLHSVQTKPRYWPSSGIARVAPHRWNGKHNMAMANMCINVRAIVGLSVLGGYFMYSCLHSGVRLCPLYGVERLPYLGG